MMQSKEEIPNNEIFTFDDWLSYKVFYHVVAGVQLCNDSRNFTQLVSKELMSSATIKEIREAQSNVFKGLVNQTIELKKSIFKESFVRESNAPNEFLQMRIEETENILAGEIKSFYRDFVSGGKYGHYIISPFDYYQFNNTEDGKEFRPENYEGLVKNNNEKFLSENLYVQAEATYYFLQYLKKLQSGEFSLGFSDENRVVELFIPAPEKIVKGKSTKKQDGGNRVTPLQMQDQIDILKKHVNDLCKQNYGKEKKDRLIASNISKQALSTTRLKSEKTLDRYVQSLNLEQTAKKYIRQLIRKYTIDNQLKTNYFD